MSALSTRAIWRAADEIGLGLTAVTVMSEVGSTNALALKYLAEGWPDGLCVLAERQSSGRGRRGRSWHSPPGTGLYLSVGVRPPRDELRQSSPTLAAAAAVLRSLDDLLAPGVALQLRWPNDLVFDGRKLCGVLAELQSAPREQPRLVLGIGLNLEPLPDEVPAEIRRRATSVRQVYGAGVDPNQLVARVLYNLSLCRARPRETLRLATERSETLGRRVQVATPAGTIRGRAAEFGSSGSLILETAEGRRELHAGDLIEPLVTD